MIEKCNYIDEIIVILIKYDNIKLIYYLNYMKNDSKKMCIFVFLIIYHLNLLKLNI
jgi:hypothetical protein